MIERLDAAHQVARLVGGARQRILLRRLAHRGCGIADFLLQRVEIRSDRLFHPARVLRGRATERVLRVADHLADFLVADASGGFVQLARRLALIATRLVGQFFELLLQIGHFRVHRVLALGELLRARLTPVTRLLEAVDVRRDVFLFFRELFRLTQGVLNVAVAPARLVAFELLLHVAQLVQRVGRLGAAVPRSVRRRATHGVRGLLHAPHRIAKLLALLVARQLLQLARSLFELVGDRPLVGARVPRRILARLREAALALDFLLLPARELLQFLHELVDLVIAGLLHRPLLHLVLIGKLVQLELEQIGEVLGHLALTAAPAAAVLHRDLHLVLLLRVLQQLQRALLGRQRTIRLHGFQVVFSRLHFLGGLRQHFGNLVERGIDDAEPGFQLAHQLFDLLTQFRLREVEEHHVLAVLFVLRLRLVADNIEGVRHDFALLPRQLAHLLAPAATPAAAHRLRGFVVLAERADLDEIDIAGRRLGPLDDIGIGRLRVVRDEVARLEPELFQINRVARAHFGQRLAAAEQIDGFRRRAIDRIKHLQRLDAIVVVRRGLEEELLDRTRL